MNNKTSTQYTEKGASESAAGTVEAQDVIVNMIKETVPRTYSVDKKLTTTTQRRTITDHLCDEDPKKDVDNIITLVEDKNNKKLISKLKISDTSDKVLTSPERLRTILVAYYLSDCFSTLSEVSLIFNLLINFLLFLSSTSVIILSTSFFEIFINRNNHYKEH